MSRIGKLPVVIPPKVKVEVKGQSIKVEGPKGKLDFTLPKFTSANVADGKVLVAREGDDSKAKALHGLSRAIINNMIKGVSEGFVKKLEIHGVGFKAAVQGDKVNLILGYSHPISHQIPAQIKVTVDENTKITIEGPDRQVVGEIAAELRNYYPPEPYKGKGVRYIGEFVRKKAGKAAGK